MSNSKITVNDVTLHTEVTGQGQETIFFSHGLLWSTKLFEHQVDHFKDQYECVAYDHRGQGQSEVTKRGYDMDTLADDAIALIEKLGIAPCHMVGLSMGGFVTMRVALKRPDLLKSVILLETSADPEPHTFKYNLLNTIVKLMGVPVVTGQVMPILFGKTPLDDPAREQEVQQWKKELLKNKKSITRSVTGVITRDGIYDRISEIKLPTLVIVGDEDVATVPEKAERIHQQIEGSKLVRIPKAGHSSTVEQPEAVNKVIEEFLQSLNAKS